MFLTRGDNPIDRMIDFLSGDLREAPITTVVHLAQCTFGVAILFILLFGGERSGG
jgi:hypothetical protein